MKRLVVMVGLPRAGKTTRALEISEALRAPIVCPDQIRLALHGQQFVASAEPVVWAVARLVVPALFAAGHDHVVLDATSTTRARRDEWRDPRWERFFEEVQTNVYTCLSRVPSGSSEMMGVVIRRMAAQFEPLGADEVPYSMMPGATGEFPNGRSAPDDEGALRVAVGHRDGQVLVDLGTPTKWFSMPRDVALGLARTIREHAMGLPP